MTIRNIVPRNNNEGQLGTENKKWNKIYTNEIFATNFTGNLTGTADNAIKDNKSQQIDATYIKNISINNDTLTVTKGNDDSQDITINNISHAISSDNAINANKLQELTAGNSKGQIPINNGIENVNLNAALLNGKASSYFATSNHTHTTATQSSNGYMSNADKKKLDGIASGAEVNQNAFANVKVGSTTIQSDAKQDTLELVAGTNISLVGDANNDKVTIGVTGKVASATTADKVNGIASDGSAINLVTGTMAGSDSFRIRIGGSNDAGYAEIATADNGNDPIYVRQYGSRFTTATRTATILDSNGNTSFPGTVTAPNFNGKATKATQDSDGNTITSTYLKRNPSSQNDMNACTVQGIYRFDGELKNAWTSTSWGTLLVFNNNYNGGSGTGGTYLVQMAFPTDGKIYMRQRVNTGAWTGWVTLARTSDNVASATKATQDSDGNAINTTYLKRSGGTMGGALNLANGTLNLAGDDCYFGDQNIAGGFCLKGANGTTSLNLINKDNVAQKASLSYAGGNLVSSVTIQGNLSGSATKATQDSAGQTINTTYVKGVTANNATLTITKGNGSTSTTTVNNVSRAEYSDRVGTNAGYTGSTTGSSLKGGLSQAAIYNNSFPFAYGNLISVKNAGANQIALEWSGTTGAVGRVAVRSARDAALGTWSAWRYLAYTDSPAFSGSPTAPTPGTSDNSTRVATTAFVQSLISSVKSLVNTKNDVYIGAGTGSVHNTSFTIPLPSGYSREQCKYAIFPTSFSIRSGGYTLNINQGTGVVSGATSYSQTGGGTRYNYLYFGYVVIAVK